MKYHTFELGNGSVYACAKIIEIANRENEVFGVLELEDNDFNVHIEFRDAEQLIKVSDWLRELYDEVKEIKK